MRSLGCSGVFTKRLVAGSLLTFSLCLDKFHLLKQFSHVTCKQCSMQLLWFSIVHSVGITLVCVSSEDAPITVCRDTDFPCSTSEGPSLKIVQSVLFSSVYVHILWAISFCLQRTRFCVCRSKVMKIGMPPPRSEKRDQFGQDSTPGGQTAIFLCGGMEEKQTASLKMLLDLFYLGNIRCRNRRVHGWCWSCLCVSVHFSAGHRSVISGF